MAKLRNLKINTGSDGRSRLLVVPQKYEIAWQTILASCDGRFWKAYRALRNAGGHLLREGR